MGFLLCSGAIRNNVGQHAKLPSSLKGTASRLRRYSRRRTQPSEDPAFSEQLEETTWSSWSQYDQEAKLNCPRGQGISALESKHNNWKEDRVWRFQCRVVNGLSTSGSWSSSTKFKGTWNNRGTNLVTGIESIHSNKVEDRTFKFRMASQGSVRVSDCNDLETTRWDSHWTRSCPAGKFLTGAYSWFSRFNRDRRFTWRCCGKFASTSASATAVAASCIHKHTKRAAAAQSEGASGGRGREGGGGFYRSRYAHCRNPYQAAYQAPFQLPN